MEDLENETDELFDDMPAITKTLEEIVKDFMHVLKKEEV